MNSTNAYCITNYRNMRSQHRSISVFLTGTCGNGIHCLVIRIRENISAIYVQLNSMMSFFICAAQFHDEFFGNKCICISIGPLFRNESGPARTKKGAQKGFLKGSFLCVYLG